MASIDIIEDAGFTAYEACDADEALLLPQRHDGQIHLLFTDVQMPGSMNGFALARKTAALWPHMSILVASGLISPQPEDMPPGAVFVGKPFRGQLIRERMKLVLPPQILPIALRD